MGEIDLTACDREPIHIPGAVQPHGALLVIRPDDLIIEQAGGSCARFCGAPAPALLGKKFEEVAKEKASAIASVSTEPEHVAELGTSNGSVDVIAHRSGDKLIVELEAALTKRRTGAQLARTAEA